MNILKPGLIAAASASCLLAIAAPAFAENHGGGHGGSQGHGSSGEAFSGGGRHFAGGHSFAVGQAYGRGGRGWGGRDYEYGSGGAFLGGLGLGYALNPYYSGGYGGYDAYDSGQCVAERRIWDPYYGQYVVREVPYPC